MNTLLDNQKTASQDTGPHTGSTTLPHRMSSRPPMHDEPFHTASDETARELTLGTTTILALFFALAMLCAAFFAFGYSLGGKHGVAAPVVTTAGAPMLDRPQGAAKPSPGSPATPTGRLLPPATPLQTVTVPTAPPPVLVKPVPVSNPRAAADATPAETPSAAPVPGSIVQVAAVSHQEDAELIASTLKRRGYAVAIRNEPQDKLFHLQLGPFPNKKDAEAMRQRLLADGFNAYIK